MNKPVILIGRDCYDNLIDCYGNWYAIANYLPGDIITPCVGLLTINDDGDAVVTATFPDADAFKRFFVEQKELESFFDSITSM